MPVAPVRSVLRLLAVWLLAFVAVTLAPWGANAEPRLIESVPREDATVPVAPDTVDLFFLEPVPAVVASLIGQDGSVSALNATVDPADPRHVLVDVPDGIGGGVWTIGWSVPDSAGRPVAGTFAFRVGDVRPPGAAMVAGEWPQPWALVTRWLAALGTGVAGGVALLGVVGRRDGRTVRAAAVGAAAVGATVALLATVVESVALALVAPGPLAVPVVDAIAAMPIGWWLRLVALGMLALLTLGLLASGRAGAPPVPAIAAALGLALAALLGLALTGITQPTGLAAPLAGIAEIAHLVVLALFAGSVAAVAFGLAPRPAPVAPTAEPAPAPTAVGRYGRLAVLLGIVALAFGILAAALVLPSPRDLLGGAYGWLLLLDGALLLVALALTARGAFAPANLAANGRPQVPVALRLAAPLSLLALLGASTLPLLAAPGAETMPTLARLDLAAAVPLDDGQPGQMHLSLAPATPGQNGVVFELETVDGTVVPPAAAPMIDLTFHPLDHPGEPRSVALVPDRFGGWATGTVDLPGAGWWRADATLVPPDGEGVRVPFWFVLPDPNVTGRGPTPPADPAAAAVFERAMATLADLRAVRYTQRLGDGSGSLYQSVLEVTDAIDDRPAAFAERSPRFEAIIVGDTQWVRQAGEEQWQERAAPSLYLPSEWAETYEGAEGFRLGPVEEIDGEPSRMVTFYLPAASRTAATWFAWWVGEETGWIRREAMVSTRHYMVYTFSDFNEEIRIEPPADRQGPPAATPAA